jgi:hypothetical protein
LPASSLKETSPSKAREINRRKGTNIERWYGREVVYSGRKERWGASNYINTLGISIINIIRQYRQIGIRKKTG